MNSVAIAIARDSVRHRDDVSGERSCAVAGPVAAVRQWGRYGYWRGRTVRRHPSVLRGRHAAPIAAFAAVAALLASPARVAALPFAALYALAILWGRAAREPLGVTAACALFFPCVHVAYGLGFVVGLLAPATAFVPLRQGGLSETGRVRSRAPALEAAADR